MFIDERLFGVLAFSPEPEGLTVELEIAAGFVEGRAHIGKSQFQRSRVTGYIEVGDKSGKVT